MYQDFKNIYHFFVAILANIFFLFPAKKIKVIGVTGTDGKTTTVSLIHHILTQSGKNSSMLSSIGVSIGGSEIDTGYHVTTPSPFALQRLLRKAVKKNCEYFVLEVTSHAIDQYRILGIPFEIGVITNVSREHLDYHKNYEEYVKTKEKLLLKSKISISNKDDKSFDYLDRAKGKNNFFTYGLKNDSDNNPKSLNFNTDDIVPNFNKYNYLAGYSVGLYLGLDKNRIEKAIRSNKMPKGRFDFVYKKDFSIIIDFAHTPNSIDNLLSFLKPKDNGRLIHVFGSAGDRDREKRPQMGEMSSKYADLLFLTAEDPRNEKVEEINNEIEKGISDKSKIEKITNRSKAIYKAVSIARKNDIIVITGKGHERSMTYGRKELPWDEYSEVEKAIKRKNE